MKIVTADITGSLIVNGVDVTNNVVSSSVFSGSIAGRVTNLEQFSASLDATFATDASVTASILVLSQSVQASQAALSSSYIATSGSYLAVSASYVITSGSYAAASASLSIRTTDLEATASINTQASASFAAYSASVSTRLTTDETNITTLTNASASFAAQSASLSTRLTTDETNFNTTSGSISGRVTLIEGQYATTGSNTFTKPQQITDVSNAISFTSTASLYTDGGLRVKGSSFVSGTAYFNNVVVYGTSSIQYITSSQLAIGTNIITLNTDTPSIRFGGISVYDSGSNNLSTGSLFWDSEKDRWIYSNPSGSTYDGGMLISGPRNTSGLGNELGTTSCALMMGQGGDHITSSAIFSYGNATCFYGQSFISSSGAAAFNGPLSVGTSSIAYSLTVNANSTQTSIGLMSGYSNAGARNWGIATNALAYGDLNIIQSTTQGGDPFSGTSKLYFSAAGIATFSCQTCAPAFYANTTSGRSFGNDSYGTNYGWIAMYGTSQGIQLGFEGTTGGQLITGLPANAGVLVSKTAGLGMSANNGGAVHMFISSSGNIGISNSSPDRKLYVADASATQSTILGYNQCTTFTGTVIEAITDRTSNSAFNLMNLKASTTSMFLVRGDGNVGIGTTTPCTRLHVYNTTADSEIRITGDTSYDSIIRMTGENGNLNEGFSIRYCNSMGDTYFNNVYTTPANDRAYHFQVGGVDKMIMSSAGITCFACQICAPTLIAGTGGIRTSNNIIFPANLTTYTIWNEGYGGAVQLRRSDATADRYSRIGIVDGSGNWVSGMTINGGTAWASFDAGVCAAQAICSPTLYSTGNIRISTATSAGNATDPAITTGGCTKVGIYFDGGCVAFGAGGNGLIFTQAGTVWGTAGNSVSNGVTTRSVGGTMSGTTAASWDFATWDDTGTGQIFEIKAFFEHYYNWGYGASLYKYMATRETANQDLTMFNCPTGNGGCWIAYKPTTTTLRVCKIAGSYVGSGAYWIQVTQKQP